jgi:hypothetical protein
MRCCEAYQTRAYAFVLMGSVSLCVDQEGVISAIRCDIDEADERAIV